MPPKRAAWDFWPYLHRAQLGSIKAHRGKERSMNARPETETPVALRAPTKRWGAKKHTMIDPIPQADDADIAEQARFVDDVIEGDEPPGDLGTSWNADLGDLVEQRLAIDDELATD